MLCLPALRGPGIVLGMLGITAALGFASPMIGGTAALLLGASPEEAGWVLLACTAPVGAGAIAAVRMMRLPGLATAYAVAASFVLAPLLVPPVAGLAAGASLDATLLAERLWLISGLPALAALLLRRVPALAEEAARREAALCCALALALLALARVDGVAEAIAEDPSQVLWLLPLATLPSLAGIAAVLILVRQGVVAELMVAGAFRNVALVWAAALPQLTPGGNLFMALTSLPIFLAPAIIAALQPGRR